MIQEEEESSITILHNSCLLERSFPTQKQAADFIDNFRTYDNDIKVVFRMSVHTSSFRTSASRTSVVSFWH